MDEMEQTQATESTTTEATPVAAPETASTESTQTTATEGAKPSEPAPYQPNYKFKSYDKEAEFDEYLRPVIKDKESEEKLRDLYTKAFGLEPMKQKYNKLQEEHAPLKDKYENLYSNVNRLGQFMSKGDLANFFSGVGLSKDQVFKWALNELQMAEDPAKAQAYAELTERRRNEMLLSEQYQATQSQLQALQSQQRMFELDQSLSRADIKAMVDAYESKVGMPGAFRNEVIQTAQSVFKTTGKDLSPVDAINEVLNRYKPFLAAAQASAQPVAQRVQSQSQAPVIPNVTGKSTSPAAKQVRSIDDLKRLSKELD